MSEYLINDYDEFYDEVQNGELYDDLTYVSDYQGKNYYLCAI